MGVSVNMWVPMWEWFEMCVCVFVKWGWDGVRCSGRNCRVDIKREGEQGTSPL